MNQHLQSILRFIEQGKSLSAEEKNTLLKSLKDADKEFEITNFKLDRTEKVKRTTAILLEETIEELEQKRKAVEAQNRELEIESSLERVRTVAMGMKKPGDLLDICEILFKELGALGFTELRNAMINIHNDEKKSLLNYDYSDNTDKTVTDIPYNFHPLVEKQIRVTKAAPDAFFEFSFAGEELKSFRELRKNNGEQDDPQLEITDALHYYFYSIGDGSVGISTYSPVNDQKLELLKRFRNVFDLAYKRYVDISKAETQAKEAQVELALERVRARTMAMYHSNELADTASVLFQQIKELGFEMWSCGFCIWKENDFVEVWMNNDSGGLLPPMMIPYKEEPTHRKIYEASLRKEIVHEYVWEGEELEKHYEFLQTIPSVKKAIDILKEAGLSLPAKQCYYAGFFKQGYLLLINKEPKTATSELTNRFAKVFDQTYTRFLDLQKAETQAREAQIEAALEKVRSTSLAIHHSHELEKVIAVLFDKLKELGVPFDSAFIYLFDKSKRNIVAWVASKLLPNPFKVNMPYDEDIVNNPIIEDLWYAIESGEHGLNKSYKERDKDDYYRYEAKHNQSLIPESVTDFQLQAESWLTSFATEKNSIVGFDSWEGRITTSEDFQLLKRFAKVFEQAYIRFLDLQKAEAQAREAQIEAALEKVRSRSLAMHRSDELKEVISVMFQRLTELDVLLGTVAIQVCNPVTKDCTFWVGNDKQDAAMVKLPYDENIILEDNYMKDFWQARKSGKSFFNKVYSFEQKNTYFRYVFANNDEDIIPPPVREFIMNAPSHINTLIIEKNSALFADNYDNQFYAEEKIDVLKRTAKVFDQAYVRFLDLQKAEVQAREAQVETALERVRSRTLAMQKSNELAEVAAVLFRQLILLGIAPNRLYIGIIKDDTGDIEAWATDEEGGKINNQFILSSARNASIKKMYDAWKAQQRSVTIDMQGKELTDYIHYLSGELHIPVTTAHTQQRRIQSVAYFNKGLIGIASPDPQPEETLQLIERFAAVFNLTYTRFNDLKIAEAHAIQAEEDLVKLQTEKKRAEDALTELRATQTQLIQSEKMASLGELTAGIAHEIQNPLNFVNNFSEVSNELIDEMMEEVAKGNYAEVKAIADDVKQTYRKLTTMVSVPMAL